MASPITWRLYWLDWSWEQRVGSNGYLEWIERLIWNGTYPAIPWLSYVFLGTLIYDFKDEVRIRDNMIIAGLIITIISIFIAIMGNKNWALTSGDALLTFFPANSLFIVVSSTMVILLMKILEGEDVWRRKSRYEEKIKILGGYWKVDINNICSTFCYPWFSCHNDGK